MQKGSVQRNAFIIFACFASVLTALFFVISLTLAYIVEDTLIENVLAEEVAYIKKEFLDTGEILTPKASYLSLYLYPTEAPELFRKASNSDQSNIELFIPDSDSHYHLARISLSEEVNPLLVANVTDLLAVRNTSSDFYILFWLAFIFSLVISLFLSYFIARHATKPLVILAKEVSDKVWDRQELRAVNLERKGKNEISYLSGVITYAFKKIKTTLDREKHFNTDLSHELRTPLTIIKNTLCLADQRSLRKDELTQIAMSADQMSKTVDALLMIARHQSAVKSRFSILQLVEECVIARYSIIEEKDFDLEVCIEDQLVVGHEDLARLVIYNLLENAIAHASDNRALIKSTDVAIEFSNRVREPFPDAPTAPLVKGDASSGLGHGLFLTVRILDALGWSHRYAFSEDIFRFEIIPLPDAQYSN